MLPDFKHRYPHGVLTEQEGGVPNDVVNWEAARHVCRKHRVTETVCVDTLPRRRVRFSDVRFVAALPLAIVADLLATWADRVDTRHASALNPGEDESCRLASEREWPTINGESWCWTHNVRTPTSPCRKASA